MRATLVNSRWNIGAGALALGAGLLASAGAAAQQQLPPAATPGVEQVPAQEIPAIELTVSVEIPGGSAPPVGAEGFTIEIKQIDVIGATVYPEKDLAAMGTGLIGKTDATLVDLYDLATAIQRRYAGDGYILSFAYLPPQSVSDGRYRIEIVEGYLQQVVFDQVPAGLETRMKPRLDALLAQRPLQAKQLERLLLAINSMPGVKLNGVLSPGERGAGATKLTISAATTPFDGKLVLDNRGSRYGGPWRASAVAGANGLARLGDRLELNAAVTQQTEESRQVGGAYTLPLDAFGTTAKLRASYGRNKPGHTLEPLEVESRSFILTGELAVPLVFDRQMTLTAKFGAEHQNLATDTLGARLSRDRITSANAEISLTYTGLFGGASAAAVSVEKGLPFVPDTTKASRDETSRADAEAGFTRLQLRAAHLQPIAPQVSLLLAASGQYSFDKLPASKEFALGGGAFGRAYDLGDAAGEHGVGLSAELRYDLGSGVSWLPKLQPYVFADWGAAWDKGSDKRATLASTGGGVRLGFSTGTAFSLEWAQATGRNRPLDYRLGEGRLLVRLEQAF